MLYELIHYMQLMHYDIFPLLFHIVPMYGYVCMYVIVLVYCVKFFFVGDVRRRCLLTIAAYASAKSTYDFNVTLSVRLFIVVLISCRLRLVWI